MNARRPDTPPRVVVLAGPNGAGKSAAAAEARPQGRGIRDADVIAQGLSGFAPERAGLAAGRIMMRRLKELAGQRKSFAFETTLASRSFAVWLKELKSSGYIVHLLYLWLPSAEMAVERVVERVRQGGHDVPGATVRRRYGAGLRNFFDLYQPLADTWQVLDNSIIGRSRLVATGMGRRIDLVGDSRIWKQVQLQTDKADT